MEFEASLIGPVVNATVKVVDLGTPFVASFFQSLAVAWRGWNGSKMGSALEGQLTLQASSDATGHVSLRVILREDFGRSDWVAEGTLLLEAGQLENIAASISKVMG